MKHLLFLIKHSDKNRYEGQTSMFFVFALFFQGQYRLLVIKEADNRHTFEVKIKILE